LTRSSRNREVYSADSRLISDTSIVFLRLYCATRSRAIDTGVLLIGKFLPSFRREFRKQPYRRGKLSGYVANIRANLLHRKIWTFHGSSTFRTSFRIQIPIKGLCTLNGCKCSTGSAKKLLTNPCSC
jgi:hypothetical protein